MVQRFHTRFRDPSVHPGAPPFGPRMVALEQAVLAPVRPTDHVEAHPPGLGGVLGRGLLGDREAARHWDRQHDAFDGVLGQDGVDPAGVSGTPTPSARRPFKPVGSRRTCRSGRWHRKVTACPRRSAPGHPPSSLGAMARQGSSLIRRCAGFVAMPLRTCPLGRPSIPANASRHQAVK